MTQQKLLYALNFEYTMAEKGQSEYYVVMCRAVAANRNP